MVLLSFFDDLHESQEELAEAAQEAQSKIDKLSSNLEKNRKLVKDTAERYAELVQVLKDKIKKLWLSLEIVRAIFLPSILFYFVSLISFVRLQ